MNEIKFLLDENVDPLFRTTFLQHEPNAIIWKIGDPGTPLKGALDPEVLLWCEDNEFILVTNNRKSMRQHLVNHLKTGRHVPGILELNPNMTVKETVEELLLIWIAGIPDEFRDLILYLPLT